MRTSLLPGLTLAVTALLVVLLGDLLDLKLESAALLGVAVGAVVALVPDRTLGLRLVGFAGGFLAAWAGYLLRAAVLPDAPGGRAVAAAVTVALCVALVAATANRFPLWSTLLGAAAMAGAYEAAFAAAPPEVVSTSLTAATTLLLTVGAGFAAAAVSAPVDAPRPAGRRAAGSADELTDAQVDARAMEVAR